MSSFDEIVTVFPDVKDVPDGLPLVVVLSGFSDAGQLAPQLDETISECGRDTLVAEFARDVLYDYRARRPVAHYDGTRTHQLDIPELQVSLVETEAGQQFLYLHGFEPDFRWESVAECLEELIIELQVSSVTAFHSIPMPVPHTRPIQSAVSGNRQDIQDEWGMWKPQTQIPASFVHMLEVRLHEASGGELPFSSFVTLVPHYLAEAEYPDVLAAALDRLESATGVTVPADSLEARRDSFDEKVSAQIRENSELESLVHGLELRYDEYMENFVKAKAHDVDLQNLPTADEIAAEFETFLASQAKKDADGDK
ncbi:MAG TPA: PAC2 family protein [Pseudoclavibacter sp.]|nr:PAC2 family protein [Pseudoclavibacter sp.]